ncbi:XRE family transcriptional regulator [Clostridium sp. AM27-31LB]|jgi:transcriptional regulator with XRE-family HTH domain|uniref:helix-turn-helix domain-containing protein n=1 Tax=Clostridium sp. AM27-31LB TaxID=2293026 RepID=UPI000E4A89C8|nr:helix-turn-helix transcriptional regulator [Clostridium sp. AM27-31LB]RHT91573.1 XRE family transcriptional regulator [Clostridium sp. AM27-31LB]
MTNTERLRKIISNSGLKYSYIAEKIGLTYQGFKNKIENKNLFNVEEVDKLCKLLNITDVYQKEEIFFAKQGDF